jgi:hypothetical protein
VQIRGHPRSAEKELCHFVAGLLQKTHKTKDHISQIFQNITFQESLYSLAEKTESTPLGPRRKDSFCTLLEQLVYTFAHSLKGMRIASFNRSLIEKSLGSDRFQAKVKTHDGFLVLALCS